MALVPLLSDRLGWPAAFVLSGFVGLAWALFGGAVLARLQRPAVQVPTPAARPDAAQHSSSSGAASPVASTAVSDDRRQTNALEGAPVGLESPVDACSSAAGACSTSGAGTEPASPPSYGKAADLGARGQRAGRRGLLRGLSRRTLVQIAVLCWTHGVIGWGFFILQVQ